MPTDIHQTTAHGWHSDEQALAVAREANDLLRAEIIRLEAAVAYCRKRLRRPEYETELGRILAGERDERIANPDRTPMTHG